MKEPTKTGMPSPAKHRGGVEKQSGQGGAPPRGAICHSGRMGNLVGLGRAASRSLREPMDYFSALDQEGWTSYERLPRGLSRFGSPEPIGREEEPGNPPRRRRH